MYEMKMSTRSRSQASRKRRKTRSCRPNLTTMGCTRTSEKNNCTNGSEGTTRTAETFGTSKTTSSYPKVRKCKTCKNGKRRRIYDNEIAICLKQSIAAAVAYSVEFRRFPRFENYSARCRFRHPNRTSTRSCTFRPT